jgi:hypothetical protein
VIGLIVQEEGKEREGFSERGALSLSVEGQSLDSSMKLVIINLIENYYQ